MSVSWLHTRYSPCGTNFRHISWHCWSWYHWCHPSYSLTTGLTLLTAIACISHRCHLKMKSAMNTVSGKHMQPADRPSSPLRPLDIVPPLLVNIVTLLRIFRMLLVSTCTAERTFSTMKLLKSYLRSSMTDDHLTGLALMYIHLEVDIDVGKIICWFMAIPAKSKPAQQAAVDDGAADTHWSWKQLHQQQSAADCAVCKWLSTLLNMMIVTNLIYNSVLLLCICLHELLHIWLWNTIIITRNVWQRLVYSPLGVIVSPRSEYLWNTPNYWWP